MANKQTLTPAIQSHNRLETNQEGFFLPIIAVALLATSPLLLVDHSGEGNKRTQLNKIQQNMIAYARTYHKQSSNSGNTFQGLYGFLPCVSDAVSARDGAEHCGSATQWNVGRIPWYSLNMPQTFNRHAECYWYVVAGHSKKNTSYVNIMHNADTPNNLSYKGQSGVAAVIAPTQGTAPRLAKNHKNRCRADFELSHFLPNITIPKYTQTPIDLSPIKSEIRLIRAETLFKGVYQQPEFKQLRDEFAQALLKCLALYTQTSKDQTLPTAFQTQSTTQMHRLRTYKSDGALMGRLPIIDENNQEISAACQSVSVGNQSIDLSKGTWASESAHRRFWTHWKDHWFYRVAPNCHQQGACIKHGGQQYAAILVFADKKYAHQNRPSQTFADYLEPPWLSVFSTSQPLASTGNDSAYCMDAQLKIVTCNKS